MVESGIVRVIDVLILTKNPDGSVEATELADMDELGPLQAVEAQLAELLAADDVEHLAAAMEPGSTAGVLIWENLWAAPFASAARRSGGQLIADGRIPIQAIIASIEADEARRPKETEMLRAARVGRVGVIGHPVAKTAVVAKAVTPGPAPVAKTAVVAAAVTPDVAVGSSYGLLAFDPARGACSSHGASATRTRASTEAWTCSGSSDSPPSRANLCLPGQTSPKLARGPTGR